VARVADGRHEVQLSDGSARFRFAGHSDRGAVRRINEDSFLAALPLFIVADGMGGHAFGDRASQAAVAAFADAFAGLDLALPELVLDAIQRANDSVRAVGADVGKPGAVSGTTLAGVAFVGADPDGLSHWMVFNVGDSRVYSWDGRTLAQLSVDHSVVQELVDLGQITRLEADFHPDRNIITRALGASPDVQADVWLLPARRTQTFLLCSDGLTKELTDDEIARIIVFHAAESARQSDGLPITLPERLVSAAIAAGGSDNVTVVVVESEMLGVQGVEGADTSNDDTVDRDALPGYLEETRPRG
jgi:serine/threonine protein phosphatase PrpC